MELTCGRCGRSAYVPDDLVGGRAFRARCPDCQGVLDVPADRPAALDDGDLAWLSDRPGRSDAAPASPSPRVSEQAVARYERGAAAERRRRGVVVAAAVVAAVAAGAGAIVLGAGRNGARPSASRAPEARGTAVATPYDAAGLAARPAAAEADPPAVPVSSAPPAVAVRRRTARISRTDRKLLDLLARKDDASVVAPEGDAVDSAVAGLDGEAVARTVAASRRSFDACVVRALRLDPALRVARRATLVVTVQPNGVVTGAFIAEEAVDRTDLGGCLAAAARRMVFPAFEGDATDVALPLSLSTGL